MQRWEYAQVHFQTGAASFRITYSHQADRVDSPADRFWATIRELGDQGWELVSVSAAGEPAVLRHWFKRPAEASST